MELTRPVLPHPADGCPKESDIGEGGAGGPAPLGRPGGYEHATQPGRRPGRGVDVAAAEVDADAPAAGGAERRVESAARRPLPAGGAINAVGLALERPGGGLAVPSRGRGRTGGVAGAVWLASPTAPAWRVIYAGRCGRFALPPALANRVEQLEGLKRPQSG